MELHQDVEWIVSVVSPEGVLHEAFFDPAQGGSDSVGFSEGSFGTLEPATIQIESDPVAIESLTFSDGVVEMKLSDLPEDLSYFYSLEFMDLEGVEALVLDFNSYDFKGIENGSHFVRWCVKDVPWSSSSKIMLRIRHVSTSMNLPSEEDQCKP